ncbi:Phage derived protein Gp49-like (DUF891) [Butyrivibrio fibrisolvens 16/4]|nr:Phage derived protein Gp49-like (DUF891) [Butyrivibrio fibrisolvens 16/4]
MFRIDFYRTVRGDCDVEDFLEDLEKRADTNKDARIQYKQAIQYIQFLEDYGTQLGENVTKHLEEDIWELRPGNNRVLFFFFKDSTFVLLHHFRKNTENSSSRDRKGKSRT